MNSGGKLKNQLHKSVPNMSAGAVSRLYESSSRPPKVISHGGGRDVILALEKGLGLGELKEAREVLSEYGNLSSPSVMVALERYLDGDASEDNLWLTSFGAGFSAHAMELKKST